LLEPNAHPATPVYQAALKADGIPFTAFSVDDLDAEVARLEEAGVEFTKAPMDVGTAKIAVLDDTCGNLIQLIELKE
ncbi:MAG: VOC family protein, partial [Pseudomonadota bacterium]